MLTVTILNPGLIVGWELGKVFYLKATGSIYPRSVAAEICSSWLSVTVPWEGAGWAWIRIWGISLKSYSNQYPSNTAKMQKNKVLAYCSKSTGLQVILKWWGRKFVLFLALISHSVSLKTELALKRQGRLMTLIQRDEAHFYTHSFKSQVPKCLKSTEGIL